MDEQPLAEICKSYHSQSSIIVKQGQKDKNSIFPMILKKDIKKGTNNTQTKSTTFVYY